ncbi:MAG: hypothetical protein LUQ65_04705 [Candidatus Helarchaeota archaeon]|nr:hypothetical protein [Candidatus Helarchaeota archaeon]
MTTGFHEIKVKGKKIKVPTICINNRTIIVTGKFIRIAAVHDEDWHEGQVVEIPEAFIEKLKQSRLKADVFTFAQKIPDIKPLYKYHMEWDNAAAIPILSFQEWWERVSTTMRKDIKRAAKREVITKVVDFDDKLVQGIMEIHNETMIRQGRHFAHYGKDFHTVKSEYSTYLDRSEFIAAYYKSELIGVIKMVYVGDLACMMQILSKTKHYDKRPTNALIAKAIEICEKKGKSYLTYGRLSYGKKAKSSLIDFKRRNGFEQILFPRYYIPLTLKGRISIMLKLHRGLRGILPGNLIFLLLGLRSFFRQRIRHRSKLPRRLDAFDQVDDTKDERAEASPGSL